MTIDGIELRAAAARRVERRCLRLGARRADAYRRFLAALHRTARPDGLYAGYNLDIAADAEISPKAVPRYLAYAETDLAIKTFREGLICRVIVLLDHPRARRNVAMMRIQSGEHAPRRRDVRTTGPGG